MKILHLIYDDVENPWIGGGGAHRTREIYRRLSRWGHHCSVLCGRYPGAEDWQDGNLRYLHRGGTSSLNTSALSYILAVYYHLLRHGRGYDVVVEDYSVFTPLLAKFLTGRPTVLQLQLYCPPESFRRFWRPIGSALYALQKRYPRCYRDAIYLNEDLASRWPQKGQQRYYIRMGIPEHYLSYGDRTRTDAGPKKISEHAGDQPSKGTPPDDGYILYLGRLMYHEKGLDVLRNACPLIWQRHPDVRFVLAGAGRHEHKVREAFAELERTHPDRITFTGFVSGPQKEDLLSKCRALVLPSREEGEGLVVLEAAAFGKPVIASCIRELLYVGREGIGINTTTGDSTALAEAIIQLCGDRQREADLSRQARAWANQHTWERKAREFEAALHEVVGRRMCRSGLQRLATSEKTYLSQ